ncbi:hypothetical protein GGG16DRAFT_119519 [Schizophyllum commune]
MSDLSPRKRRAPDSGVQSFGSKKTKRSPSPQNPRSLSPLPLPSSLAHIPMPSSTPPKGYRSTSKPNQKSTSSLYQLQHKPTTALKVYRRMQLERTTDSARARPSSSTLPNSSNPPVSQRAHQGGHPQLASGQRLGGARPPPSEQPPTHPVSAPRLPQAAQNSARLPGARPTPIEKGPPATQPAPRLLDLRHPPASQRRQQDRPRPPSSAPRPQKAASTKAASAPRISNAPQPSQSLSAARFMEIEKGTPSTQPAPPLLDLRNPFGPPASQPRSQHPPWEPARGIRQRNVPSSPAARASAQAEFPPPVTQPVSITSSEPSTSLTDLSGRMLVPDTPPLRTCLPADDRGILAPETQTPPPLIANTFPHEPSLSISHAPMRTSSLPSQELEGPVPQSSQPQPKPDPYKKPVDPHEPYSVRADLVSTCVLDRAWLVWNVAARLLICYDCHVAVNPEAVIKNHVYSRHNRQQKVHGVPRQEDVKTSVLRCQQLPPSTPPAPQSPVRGLLIHVGVSCESCDLVGTEYRHFGTEHKNTGCSKLVIQQPTLYQKIFKVKQPVSHRCPDEPSHHFDLDAHNNLVMLRSHPNFLSGGSPSGGQPGIIHIPGSDSSSSVLSSSVVASFAQFDVRVYLDDDPGEKDPRLVTAVLHRTKWHVMVAASKASAKSLVALARTATDDEWPSGPLKVKAFFSAVRVHLRNAHRIQPPNPFQIYDRIPAIHDFFRRVINTFKQG